MAFKTTKWSIVLSAQRPDEQSARQAMSQLCELYWFPLYSYVRRRGYRDHEAQDLTQEFFHRFLENEWVRRADPERGRFRAFLLTCVKNFLANQWDKSRAQKRGGGQKKLSLDFDRGEGLLADLSTDKYSPEALYDRQWAETVFARCLGDLKAEYVNSGRGDLFEALKSSLTSGADALPHLETARNLGMSAAAVTVAVHRLRKRFGERLRKEIAQTLSDDALVEEELRYLISLL